MKSFPPIALFVYNRAEHTQRTLHALARNEGAAQSDLFVFCDGVKHGRSSEAVERVRSVVRLASGFRSVTVIERDHNFGLARSIISGVSEVLEHSNRIIVVEDDLVTAPDFLLLLNQLLEHFAQHPRVFSVAGYNWPMKLPPNYLWDVYFSHRFMSWGWGTWRDRWSMADWDLKDFAEFTRDRRRRAAFNLGGDDLSDMLSMQQAGLIDSW